jgi:predicted ATPase
MLRVLPETSERARQELNLQTMVGQSLMVAKGYALPEVEQSFIRARELSIKLNEPVQLFRSEFSLAIVYVVRAEYERAFEHGEKCLRLAERSENKVPLMQAHWVIGLSQCYLGNFAAARDHFEHTIDIHDAAGIDSIFSMYGAVLSRAHLARMLLYLGYPDQSHRVMNEAIARAQHLRHPVGAANTLSLASYLQAFHRDVPKTMELVESAAKQSEEHGLPYYIAVARLMRGWALAMQNDPEGIELIRDGLQSYLATGTKQQHGYFLGLLAEALCHAGHTEEALATLRQAIDVSTLNNEPYYEAELYRLLGAVLARGNRDALPEAESCFHRAIEISRQQQAKSFELRAVTDLARLWHQHGKSEEARTVLAESYRWFTEGFETPDLSNARELLEELSASSH